MTEVIFSNSEWAKVRQNILGNFGWVASHSSKEWKMAEKLSQPYAILGFLLENAEQLGVAEKTETAFELASDLAWSTSAPLSAGNRQKHDQLSEFQRDYALTYWAEADLVERTVKRDGRLRITRDKYESTIGDYLKSGLQDPRIDRILVLSLTDLEITAYFDEIHSVDLFSQRLPYQVSNTSAPLLWLKGRVNFFALSLSIVAISWGLSFFWQSGPEWLLTFGIATGTLLFGLSSAISLFAYPSAKAAFAKMSEPMDQVRGLMSRFYSEFRTAGPISTPFFRSQVEELRSCGVIWPSSLWPLLDDMESRGIRHF